MVAAGVVTASVLAFEAWLWTGWRRGGPAEKAVAPAAPHARLPDYQLPPPEATVVNVPVVTRVPEPVPTDRVIEVPAPAPPREPPRPAPEPPRRPKALSWKVSTEGQGLDWYVDGRRPRLAEGCALRPGATIVEAVLLTTVQSEVAGQAIAEVTSDVYDVDGLGRLLVPAGTRVVGAYKRGGLEFQRRRLDFAWTEMTLPGGRQVNLGEAAGMDAAGSMGVGGQVRVRWGELLATAALVTVFDVAQRGAVGDSGASFPREAAAAAGRNAGDLGEDVAERALRWEPEILVRAGTQLRISPQKTIRVC
jgi:hypothetical protein